MVWEVIGGGSWDRRADSSSGGVDEGDTRHLLGEMPSHQKAATSGVLRITVSHVLYPVTKEVLHQVLEAYGVEKMSVFQRGNQVEAMVQLRSWQEAKRARDAFHGGCIYEGCCFLDILLVQPTPDSASTTTARRDAEASAIAPEVVVADARSSPSDTHPTGADEPMSEPVSSPSPGWDWEAMSDEQKDRCLRMVTELNEKLRTRLGRSTPSPTLCDAQASSTVAIWDHAVASAATPSTDATPTTKMPARCLTVCHYDDIFLTGTTVNAPPVMVLQQDTIPDGTRVLTSTPSSAAVNSIDLGDEHVPNIPSCQLSARKVFEGMRGTCGISYGFSTIGLVLTTCCPDKSSTAGISVVDRAVRRRERAHCVLILARLGNSCEALEFRKPWPPPTQVDVTYSGVEYGDAAIAAVEDGKLMADAEAGEFWGLFGGFAPLPRKTPSEDNGKDSEIVAKLLCFNQGKLEYISFESLAHELLETNKCYLLDCGAEMYVWMGRSTSLQERKDGFITVVDGKTLDNELEAVRGMKLSRGYISPYLVTDQKTQKYEMENPLILIHDKKISNMNSLLPVLEISIKNRKPLVIVAEDVEGEALSMLVLNKHCAGLKDNDRAIVGIEDQQFLWDPCGFELINKVLFADKVLKFTQSGKMKRRILVITDFTLYLIDPDADVLKRRIALAAIDRLCISNLSDNFFAIIMPMEYDCLMASTRKKEIVDVIVKAIKSTSEYEPEVASSNRFEYHAAAEPEESELSEPVLKYQSNADLKNALLHMMIHAICVQGDFSLGESCGDTLVRAAKLGPPSGACSIEDVDNDATCGNMLWHWHNHKMKCGGIQSLALGALDNWTYMLLMSPATDGKPHAKGLHQLDIETGKVVSEWEFEKDGADINMRDITNDSKGAQMDPSIVLVGYEGPEGNCAELGKCNGITKLDELQYQSGAAEA